MSLPHATSTFFPRERKAPPPPEKEESLDLTLARAAAAWAAVLLSLCLCECWFTLSCYLAKPTHYEAGGSPWTGLRPQLRWLGARRGQGLTAQDKRGFHMLTHGRDDWWNTHYSYSADGMYWRGEMGG